MSDQALREHLKNLLLRGQAHISLSKAIRGFPVEKAGIRPPGSPHSAWELLEHIRIAQEDISQFSGALEDGPRPAHDKELPAGYKELKFPDDYWPSSPAPSSPQEWKKSAAAIEHDLEVFLKALADPRRDLLAPFPWGSGQTLLRQALLIADHNSYHLGQLMLLHRMLE